MSAVTTRPAPAPDDLEPEEPARRRTVLWTVLVAAVLVAALGVALGTRAPAGTRQASSPLIGRPVPLGAGETVSGAPFRPATLRGRWTLVNFFATWCVPCRHEHPELVAFSHRHPDDAQIVGVVFQDDPAQVTQWFAQRGGDWPVLRDPSGRTALDFGVTGVPESYLVDPDGVVVAKIVGGVEADELDALVRQAKAGARR